MVALFELCQFGSGEVSLGAIVTEKCVGDFLSRLTGTQGNGSQGRAWSRIGTGQETGRHDCFPGWSRKCAKL
jgi:hypothetical protein